MAETDWVISDFPKPQMAHNDDLGMEFFEKAFCFKHREKNFMCQILRLQFSGI